MKKLFCVLIAMIMFSITSYAGQWQHNDHGYWYQNDDGSYKTGWYQDIDGKWYYFDNQSGYMLANTTTPDGFYVAEDGAWLEGGEKTMEYSDKTYDNREEFEVTAYKNHSTMVNLNYKLPVTVYYNNAYRDEQGLEIEISNMSVSKDGLLCYRYIMNARGRYYELNITHNYVFADGTSETDSSLTGDIGRGADIEKVGTLLWDIGELKEIPISVEIYIDLNRIE